MQYESVLASAALVLALYGDGVGDEEHVPGLLLVSHCRYGRAKLTLSRTNRAYLHCKGRDASGQVRS